MFPLFLLSYSLGQLEKAVATLAYQPLFPQHFSFSQTFTRASIAWYFLYVFLKTIKHVNLANQRMHKCKCYYQYILGSFDFLKNSIDLGEGD